MKYFNENVRDIARRYKGILHNCVVRMFLGYDINKRKISYKKRVEFVSTSNKGKKRKHFFDDQLHKGYYVCVGEKKHHQHNHNVVTYELTEAGEVLFLILNL